MFHDIYIIYNGGKGGILSIFITFYFQIQFHRFFGKNSNVLAQSENYNPSFHDRWFSWYKSKYTYYQKEKM